VMFQSRGTDHVECLTFLFQLSFLTLGKVRSSFLFVLCYLLSLHASVQLLVVFIYSQLNTLRLCGFIVSYVIQSSHSKGRVV